MIENQTFAIPGSAPAAPVISPTRPLPAITDAVDLDARTQGPTGQVVINGSAAGASANGLAITGGNTTIRGVVIQRFGNIGIVITGSGNNVIAGNRIGTTADGLLPAPNGGSGIVIDGPPSNRIGGGSADRNVLSGNRVTGITVMNGATGNLIQGNYIGVGADGLSDVANQIAGLDIQTANNVIRGNVISGNNVVGSFGGLYLETGATANLVAGNLIGLAADGSRALGNAGPGVVITGAASRNTIGGLVAADRNVISGNVKQGIHIAGATSSTNVIQGNYVGTDAAGLYRL